MPKRLWNDKLDNLLRRHYPKGDLDALAARIGTTKQAVKCRAQKLGITRKVNVKKPWTDRQLSYLRRHYADATMEQLVKGTGHPADCVWGKAAALGLTKSTEYLSAMGKRVAECMASKAKRFQPGHVPANKGKREHEFRSPEAIERCRRTQFKPGSQPHNTRTDGTEVTHGDGYVYIKVAGRCVLKHRYVYEQHHGAIPRGMLVVFRDGNRQNCDISNLELITMAENARRNNAKMTPEARAALIARCAEKRRETIRKDKMRIRWGLEPKTHLVKRWYEPEK